jgi:hypothetical protein
LIHINSCFFIIKIGLDIYPDLYIVKGKPVDICLIFFDVLISSVYLTLLLEGVYKLL